MDGRLGDRRVTQNLLCQDVLRQMPFFLPHKQI